VYSTAKKPELAPFNPPNPQKKPADAISGLAPSAHGFRIGSKQLRPRVIRNYPKTTVGPAASAVGSRFRTGFKIECVFSVQ
jgi:hypothetical protein